MTDSAINTGQEIVLAEHAPDCRPAPKWAALINDRVIPMPQRTLTAQTIKAHAGIGSGFVLVRDFEAGNEVVADHIELDLGRGNVLRAIPRCEAAAYSTPRHEPAKLAFVLDDEWEVTINPHQTGATLRRLFELSPEFELLRNHDSPHDEPIADEESINFVDGPVFRTKRTTFTVSVNNNPVTFHKRHVTGLKIKETAIAQKVKIPLDGILYKVKLDGGLGPSIGDTEKVTLRECEEFRCVTPDDNS